MRTSWTARPAIWTLGGQLALILAGNALPTPLFPAYRRAWGLSSGSLTAVFAVYVVGIVLALVIGGQFSDHIGRRPVIAASLAVAAASATLALAAPQVAWLYAARVLQGVSAGLMTGAAAATITDLTDHPARAARTTAMASMIGVASGLLVVGALAEYVPAPIRTPWAVYLALLVPALLCVRRLPETVSSRSFAGMRHQGLAVPIDARLSFASLATGGALAFACMGLFAALGPTLVVTVLGVHDVLLGAAVAAGAYVASGTVQPMLGRRSAPVPAGIAALAVGLGALVAAAHTGSVVLLLLSAMLVGAGHGATFLGTFSAGNRLAAPQRRAAVASTYFLASYVGVSVPVLGVGLLADVTSLLTATTGFAAVIGVLLLLIGVALSSRVGLAYQGAEFTRRS